MVAILRKLGDDDTSQSDALKAIDLWLQERLAKQSSTAHDIADCMRVFASRSSTLGGAVSHAEALFAQKGSIQLLTGHKAKGLEWDIVYHLDPWLVGEDEQDLNLKYVITTRSKDQFYEIDSRDIKWI